MGKNRNQTQFDEYRDWQWVKHLILKTYVVPWSVIVGKWARSIFVVDACAGAGSYTDPDTEATISEGSPVIFARRAKAYNAERGPGKTMHVLCCERDQDNYGRLMANLRPYEGCYTLMPRGGFARHVPQIAERIGSSPALVLLDPIGVATIPADAWEPLLTREGKTDLFVVLHFAGVHRLRGWMLPDGSPNPAIEGARAGVLNMDRVFKGQEWRAIALDPRLDAEGHREERERTYVQLFLDQVIGVRHEWKGYIAVRARYSSPVKYWLTRSTSALPPRRRAWPSAPSANNSPGASSVGSGGSVVTATRSGGCAQENRSGGKLHGYRPSSRTRKSFELYDPSPRHQAEKSSRSGAQLRPS